jgi:hypothetical protein
MERRSLGFRWVVFALTLALASCVPPRNFAARTRRRVRAMASTPALTLLLVVPSSSLFLT